MIKWYYKLKRIFMPIIILIIAACFIIVPLSIFFAQKSAEKEIAIDKPELEYKQAPMEINIHDEEIEGGGKLRTSDWVWTYDLSALDGFSINDYEIYAYKLGAENYKDHVDSEGNRTYWSKKPVDGDWTETLLWDSLNLHEDDLTDAEIEECNNDLTANVSEWRNDGTQIIKGVTSSEQGYTLSAKVSVTKLNDNGVPITFDNVSLGPDLIKTESDDNTKYISTPFIPNFNLDAGTLAGVFENNKNLYVNPYEFNIWPRIDLNPGFNDTYLNEIYDIVPHVKANIYYDIDNDVFVPGADENYDPENDFLIASIDKDQQVKNGMFMFDNGKQPMSSKLYDENSTLIKLDPNSFKVDIKFNYKFKPLEELKTIMEADYILPESGHYHDFDYITDTSNPEEYILNANNITLTNMEGPIDAMAAKIAPESLSTIISTNDMGYTQITLATRDDYIFNSDTITEKDYSMEAVYQYFSDLQGPETMFDKFLAFSTFNKNNIGEDDYIYSSTDTYPKMFPSSAEYFIDPNSSLSIERDGDDHAAEDWTIAYGLQELKYYYEKETVELINYESRDEIPDLIPAKGETGFKLIAPSNVHYRNIERDNNTALMHTIIILLMLVLVVPIIISIMISFIRSKKSK